MTGARFQFVPYRGAGPAMQDLVAGQIDIMVDQAANSLPQVRSGTIKALCGHRQDPPGGGARHSDRGRGRRAGAPHLDLARAVDAEGHAEGHHRQAQRRRRRGLGRSGVRQRLADLGQEIPPREQQTPQALAAYHKAEIEKWWPIIKAANIKGE